MIPIFLVSVKFHRHFPQSEAQADVERCLQALRIEFPGSTFDSTVLANDVGIRFHHDGKWDLEHPRVKEKRDFARGFMASAHLWER